MHKEYEIGPHLVAHMWLNGYVRFRVCCLFECSNYIFFRELDRPLMHVFLIAGPV